MPRRRSTVQCRRLVPAGVALMLSGVLWPASAQVEGVERSWLPGSTAPESRRFVVATVVDAPAWEWAVAAPHRSDAPAPSRSRAASSVAQAAEVAPSIGLATGLSTLVPGAGQYYLGQRRAWVYLAIEAAGLYLWADRRSAGAELRDGYRDYAWEEARIQVNPRRDGDFDYYETMSKWQRSGDFDTDPIASGIQPETEAGTFNASIWSLASRLFLGAPGAPDQAAMDRALEYYVARAYPTDQLWDWDMSTGGRVRFGELIAESDDRFRQATNVLGAVIANHLVSAIDAFASARGIGESVEMRLAPSVVPDGVRWYATVRVGAR